MVCSSHEGLTATTRIPSEFASRSISAERNLNNKAITPSICCPKARHLKLLLCMPHATRLTVALRKAVLLLINSQMCRRCRAAGAETLSRATMTAAHHVVAARAACATGTLSKASATSASLPPTGLLCLYTALAAPLAAAAPAQNGTFHGVYACTCTSSGTPLQSPSSCVLRACSPASAKHPSRTPAH